MNIWPDRHVVKLLKFLLYGVMYVAHFTNSVIFRHYAGNEVFKHEILIHFVVFSI